jgi:TldD protein
MRKRSGHAAWSSHWSHRVADPQNLRFKAAAQRALDTAAARGASYADVRFEEDVSERIEVRNGNVATLEDGTSTGYGMRAFYQGSWGFAASADTSDVGLDATAARAVEIAKAGASVATRRFGEAPTDHYVDRFATPIERDPSEVPLGERVALLLDAEKGVHVGPLVAVGRAWIDLWRTEKEFYSSIGSQISQSLYQSGSGLSALAVGEGDAQDRSFPGDIGLYQTGGWEIIEEAQLRENAARIGEEAIALLTASQCPAGTMDVILGGSQVSLQIHESCGHAAELDRIMGWEANFSGTSFLDPEELGKLKYGSDAVTIIIDNTLPRGLATVGYDDEGTKSVQSDIIRNGMLAGFEMSRDTARTIGRTSNACVRSENWRGTPMIRMCNLNLLPGSVPFEALFDGVKHGIYMESNRSWSIDDHRLNFQFGCQIGWEIIDGKRGRMLKNPTYAGVTPQFWNSCDAIADKNSWRAWGTPNCGKGEPMQSGRTAQCAAPARFRNVQVGIGYSG